MIKRFFLAALAAVALTMGFTSCSEDDENEPFAGDYKLSGCVSIVAYNDDAAELKHIYNVYCQALGADVENQEFTINGKDSANCVSNILACCKNAEAKLVSETWDGAFEVKILINDFKTKIYQHVYAENGDNGPNWPTHGGSSSDTIRYYSFKMHYPETNLPENSFVTSFSTQENGSTNICGKSDWTKTIFHSCSELNRCSSHNLYLCMHLSGYTHDDVKSMVHNNDSKLNNLIGDVKVLYFYHGNEPTEFTYKGAKYEICRGGTMGEREHIDLNYKSGGPYMYLYVSHDVKHFNRVLDGGGCAIISYSSNFFFGDTEGPRPETSELVQGIYMDDNGNLSDYDEDGIDLNKETGGKYRKLRLSYVPLDEFGEELEVVDLGLSTGTKWANKNVGANSVEDYGYYFAWGETVPFGMVDRSNAQNYSSAGWYEKVSFEWSTYKWCDGTSAVSKYNQDDYMTVLEPEDDAATARLGEHWRTPYKSDIRELIDGCDWTWTTQNGVTGYQVKSKTNGNSIFLPAAGYRSKNDLLGEEDYVYIWSANCDFDVPYRAYYMSRSTKGYSINTEQRYLGMPVRAVYVE